MYHSEQTNHDNLQDLLYEYIRILFLHAYDRHL